MIDLGKPGEGVGPENLGKRHTRGKELKHPLFRDGLDLV
jgi:hypothetical protein